MIANIEEEYNRWICTVWGEIADVPEDDFESHQKLEHKYNTISLESMQFLQDKLKSIETREEVRA